ncbi:hypothetical protein HMPREF9440_00383 [Sutterella parvirubra YIT 11816]|uniref:Uncharacterized protein n=1 Tax=Sutterella parvirubra YIT 11816 TaxID=762967 RepID=H3KCD2_9BURK|nr:hypothetical protein HMPREF9440_00383 [Sutterella parvirubra YIT 11816]
MRKRGREEVPPEEGTGGTPVAPSAPETRGPGSDGSFALGVKRGGKRGAPEGQTGRGPLETRGADLMTR